MIEVLGKRLQTRLKVLEELIRDVDKKYKGVNKCFLEEYIKETKENFMQASDAYRDKIFECLIESRDRK